MIFVKIVTALVGLLILSILYLLWACGKNLAQSRGFSVTYAELLEAKKRVLLLFCIFNLVAIGLIRLLVRMSPNPYATAPALQLFHYSLDALVTVLFLAILLRFSGVRRPDVHRYWAYAFIAVYLGVVVTGSTLLYLLPN